MSIAMISTREIYFKIVEHSLLSNKWITLALKDDYRQSGQVKNINISFSEDGENINGSISFHDGLEFAFSEIADIYS